MRYNKRTKTRAEARKGEEMYEAVIVFENVVDSYTPAGWSRPKKEYEYREYKKKFARFVDIIGYLSYISQRNDVVKAEYINHKTGERKEWLI